MIITRREIRRLIENTVREALSQQDHEDVRQTAHLVHLGQKRRDDTPYISHPEAVYDITASFYPDDEASQMLALLHDTLEDAEKAGNVSQSEAYEMIQASIHDEEKLARVNNALQLLTHDRAIPYNEYLQSALFDPLAGRVKISDLIHNLSHNPSARQIQKYKSALTGVKIPPHISRAQLSALYGILGATSE
jgi:(p)ppGpp synthase/HD superfamily hydrolase